MLENLNGISSLGILDYLPRVIEKDIGNSSVQKLDRVTVFIAEQTKTGKLLRFKPISAAVRSGSEESHVRC